MLTRDLDYPLPPSSIAQRPVEPRDAARLLVDAGPGRPPVDLRISDLPRLVGPGDVIVVNETRVRRARLTGRRPTGGRAEVLVLEPVPGDGPGVWDALVRPSGRMPPGTPVTVADDLVVVVGDDLGEGRRRVRLLDGRGDPLDGPGAEVALERHGEVPLPPYIRTPAGDLDPERYQTTYATVPGSVAAPTAGLHLTPPVLEGCRRRGAHVCAVELRVGIDTFRPLSVEDTADLRMHTEWYRVPPGTWSAVRSARRVLAVGTTTVRALESAARGPLRGRTGLCLSPEEPPRVVDILLTNFHMPRSSLLLLVAAFVGPRWRDLYRTALERGYRFLSFGDAMLIARADREPPARPVGGAP